MAKRQANRQIKKHAKKAAPRKSRLRQPDKKIKVDIAPKSFLIKGYPIQLWGLGLFIVSLGFSFKLDIPLALFAITAIYALSMDVKRDFQLRGIFSDSWHVLVFMAVTAVVTLCSWSVVGSLQAQVQFLPALLVYVVALRWGVGKEASGKLEAKDALTFITWSIVLAGLLTSGTLLVEVLLSGGEDALDKIRKAKSPVFISPNDVLLLSVLVPFALCALLSTKRYLFKAFAALYLLLAVFAVMYLRSRQAVGVYVIAIFLFFFLLRPIWGVAIGAGVLSIVLAVDIGLGKSLINKILLFPRIYIWDAAWAMFVDRPVTGFGPGAFKEFYYEYLEKAGHVFEEIKDRRPMNWAHSLYFEQLAERGLLGLIALLVLIGRPLMQLVQYWRSLNSELSPRLYSVAAILSSLAAFLLAGIAESSLLRLWVVVILFLLIGLADGLIRAKPTKHRA